MFFPNCLFYISDSACSSFCGEIYLIPSTQQMSFCVPGDTYLTHIDTTDVNDLLLSPLCWKPDTQEMSCSSSPRAFTGVSPGFLCSDTYLIKSHEIEGRSLWKPLIGLVLSTARVPVVAYTTEGDNHRFRARAHNLGNCYKSEHAGSDEAPVSGLFLIWRVQIYSWLMSSIYSHPPIARGFFVGVTACVTVIQK